MDISQAFRKWLVTAEAICALPLTVSRRAGGGLVLSIQTLRSLYRRWSRLGS